MTHENLLASAAGNPPPTLLPDDPIADQLLGAAPDRVTQIVRSHPASSLGWAVLAEQALDADSPEGEIAAYAYARTGYHRGLDALRRAGWRGAGPIPWEHEPNRGFLRALWALARAADRIGEREEYERCAQFLRDSSHTAYAVLTG